MSFCLLVCVYWWSPVAGVVWLATPLVTPATGGVKNWFGIVVSHAFLGKGKDRRLPEYDSGEEGGPRDFQLLLSL